MSLLPMVLSGLFWYISCPITGVADSCGSFSKFADDALRSDHNLKRPQVVVLVDVGFDKVHGGKMFGLTYVCVIKIKRIPVI